jgi:uncharacterized Zn-finger protein
MRCTAGCVFEELRATPAEQLGSESQPSPYTSPQRSEANQQNLLVNVLHPNSDVTTQFNQTIAAHYLDGREISGSITSHGELRCYEHGCEGRTFSRIENYKRHLREKNGTNTVRCTLCHQVFTRKSNMTNHILQRRCSIIKEFDEMDQAQWAAQAQVA